MLIKILLRIYMKSLSFSNSVNCRNNHLWCFAFIDCNNGNNLSNENIGFRAYRHIIQNYQ